MPPFALAVLIMFFVPPGPAEWYEVQTNEPGAQWVQLSTVPSPREDAILAPVPYIPCARFRVRACTGTGGCGAPSDFSAPMPPLLDDNQDGVIGAADFGAYRRFFAKNPCLGGGR